MCLLSFYCSWVNACVGSFLAVNMNFFSLLYGIRRLEKPDSQQSEQKFLRLLFSLCAKVFISCVRVCVRQIARSVNVWVSALRVYSLYEGVYGRSYGNLYTCRGTCTHINARTVTLAPAMSTKRNVSTIGERGLVARTRTLYAAVYHCTVYTQQIYPFLLFAKSISSVWRISSNDVIDM